MTDDEGTPDPTADPIEPSGHTVDGTPWEEPRPPHLPDPVVGAAARVPWQAWVFLTLAVLDVVWVLRDLVGQLSTITPLVLLSMASVIPPVATFLFGAALFIRHRGAATSDPMLVFGVSLLAASQVLRAAGRFAEDVFEQLTPVTVASYFSVPLSRVFFDTIVGVLAIFGVLYLARGLVDAREHPDDDRATGLRAVVFLAAAIVILADGIQVASFLTTAGDDFLTRDLAYLLLSYVLYIGVPLAWLYVGATAWRGATADERPERAWRLAAAGAWAIVIGSAISSIGYAVIAVVAVPETLGDFVSFVFGNIGVLTAIGYLLVLAAFVDGLPGTDEVGPDVDLDEDPDVDLDEDPDVDPDEAEQTAEVTTAIDLDPPR